MILNLSHLNEFTEKVHFKMDTLMNTLALIVPDSWLLSMDFQDAYYSVSIFPPQRKYLKFSFEGKLYEYTVLPNRLADAPRFFTKLVKIALTFLRENEDLTISGYLDDEIQVIYDSAGEALRQGWIAADLFQRLGIHNQCEKECFVSHQKVGTFRFYSGYSCYGGFYDTRQNVRYCRNDRCVLAG